MNKLLIATTNPGKLREMREFLAGHFELLSLSDLPGAPDVEETGTTFEENALLKARAYFAWSRIPVLADDGGLEIEVLNGQPGVLSRRWPLYGEQPPYREKTDEELLNLTFQNLQGLPQSRRDARLRVVGAYCNGSMELTETAQIHGWISEQRPETWEKGYPFRSIFMVSLFNTLLQDLTSEQHARVNHRAAVYRRLSDRIRAVTAS
jgi:XTP/dITP diphosphohydrolase